LQASDALYDLSEELQRYRQNVVSSSLLPLEKGIVEPELGLYYRPYPRVAGQGSEKRIIVAGGGQFLPAMHYNDKKLESILQVFLASSKNFLSAKKLLAESMGGVDSHNWMADLLLTAICHHLWTTASQGQVNNSTLASFLKSIGEGDFRVVVNIGLEGVCLSEDEIVLQEEQDERTLLKQPRIEDLAEDVLVVEHWDPRLDAASVSTPSFPAITSSIVIESKNLHIFPAEISLVDVKFYSHLRIIEWLVQNMELRISEMRTIIDLFQSKTALRVLYHKFGFYVGKISSNRPLYSINFPLEKTVIIREPFAVTSSNKENLKVFWKEMRELGILNRAYQGSGKEPYNSSYSPTQLAFQAYHQILRLDEEPVDKIHDTVEALEGLFTPEKFATKRYIQRAGDLIQLLGVDPNDTHSFLNKAWQVRSEYSHHGKGWDDQDHLEVEGEIQAGVESIRRTVDKRDRLTKLSKLVLNYLRICVLARLVLDVKDREFIRLIDSPEGMNKLRTDLDCIRFSVAGDPPIRWTGDIELLPWSRHPMRYWRIIPGHRDKHDYAKSVMLGDWLRRGYISMGWGPGHPLYEKFREIRRGDMVAVVTDGYVWGIAKVTGDFGKMDTRPYGFGASDLLYRYKYDVAFLKVTRVKYREFPEDLRNKLKYRPAIIELTSDDWITLTASL
jgi:hypothetical protein